MLKLRELRLEKEKTQEEIAKIFGISRQVYANYEKSINEPSLETLIKMANYFDVSIDYLLGRSDDFENVTIKKTHIAPYKEEIKMNLFIPRFRDLLNTSGKQQKEICADLGIRNQKLSNWKTGYSEPNFNDIIMLANYFDVSTDYLLGKSDDFGNVTIKNTSVALSQNDQALLDSFHSLPKDLQNQLLGYIDFLKLRAEYNNNLSKK